MSADRSQARAPVLNRLFDLPDVSATRGLRWARSANHLQRHVARGGLLFMDEQKLGFQPRGIDALFGARTLTWELASITDLALKPTLRKLRVTITTPAGKQRFIVSNPAVVFNDLQSWRESHGDPARPVRTVPLEEGGASA
jgi:hypothetical protein